MTWCSKVAINMCNCVHGMLEEFSLKFVPDQKLPPPAKEHFQSPAKRRHLIKHGRKSTLLLLEAFACKKEHDQFSTQISSYCAGGESLALSDRETFVHLIKHLNEFRENMLSLSADSLTMTMRWADSLICHASGHVQPHRQRAAVSLY